MAGIYRDLLAILDHAKEHGELPEGVTTNDVDYIMSVVGGAARCLVQ